MYIRKIDSSMTANVPAAEAVCPVCFSQGGSLLASPFLKGFLAGYVVSRLRSSAVLGVALGTLTGIYAAQNYQVPNIESSIQDFLNSLKKGPSDQKWTGQSQEKRRTETIAACFCVFHRHIEALSLMNKTVDLEKLSFEVDM